MGDISTMLATDPRFTAALGILLATRPPFIASSTFKLNSKVFLRWIGVLSSDYSGTFSSGIIWPPPEIHWISPNSPSVPLTANINSVAVEKISYAIISSTRILYFHAGVQNPGRTLRQIPAYNTHSPYSPTCT